MKTSIYISNDQIQVLSYNPSGTGRVKAASYISRVLPEHSIFNGVITDMGALSSILSEMVQSNRRLFTNASLTIDTNAVLTKKINVPQLKDWQYQKVAREELANNSGSYDDLIYDYALKQEKDNLYMLGMAVNRPLVESYLSLFQGVGVQLSAIYIGMDLIIDFVKNFPELNRGSVALSIIDGVSMLSMIFDEGRFMFATRTRIIADTEQEFAVKILQSLTSLIQFNRSVSVSYYMGVSPSLMDMMRETKPTGIEAELRTLDCLKNVENASVIGDLVHYSIIGAFAGKKNINLTETYRKSFSKVKKQQIIKPWHLIAGLLILGVIGSFVFLKYQTFALQAQIKQIKAYVENPDHVAERDYVNELTQKTEQLLARKTQYQTADAIINLYPQLSPDIINWLYNKTDATVGVESFDFDAVSGKISLNLVAGTQLDSTAYVSRIESYEDFESIAYKGYSKEATGFRFSIVIKLVAREVSAE